MCLGKKAPEVRNYWDSLLKTLHLCCEINCSLYRDTSQDLSQPDENRGLSSCNAFPVLFSVISRYWARIWAESLYQEIFLVNAEWRHLKVRFARHLKAIWLRHISLDSCNSGCKSFLRKNFSNVIRTEQKQLSCDSTRLFWPREFRASEGDIDLPRTLLDRNWFTRWWWLSNTGQLMRSAFQMATTRLKITIYCWRR